MMIWRYIKYSTSILLTVIILSGCFQSDYTKLVKSELAKGIRQDSILLGIKLGNTRDDFFGKCFDLNKQKLVTQGPRGLCVEYVFSDSILHQKSTQIKLLFCPSFDQTNVMSNMDLEFSYTGWAPWNKQLQADSLKGKVMALMMDWYKGNEFVIAKVEDSEVPVKLDGNRRLMVFIKDAQSVVVRVQDILHPKFKHSINSGEETVSSKN